jgi:two-component system NtrC family sensor kinase
MRRLLSWQTWQLRGSAAETVMVLAVATLVVPLLLFAGASWIAYDDTQKQAEERIARTLDLLYINVRTSFETDYLVAANVVELIDQDTNATIRANERQIHERLKRLVESLPQVGDVWVLDEEGRPLVTARVFPVPTGVTFADRAYFAAHREGKAQRYVSESLRGRVKDVEFFQYSERRQRPDGSFNGVVAVSISPKYYLDQFAQA